MKRPAMEIFLGTSDLGVLGLKNLFTTSQLEGQGQSTLSVCWTPLAVSNLLDTVGAFGKAFSDGSLIKPDGTKPPYVDRGTRVNGLQHLKFNLHNLQPSWGQLNRTGIHLGISTYFSQDSPCVMRCKMLWVAFMFFIGLDYLPGGT